ncbi:type IV pilin protein [Pseudomonas sp. ZM23]|uniref:Type IV pilin protein n=1 Tax=Pseudomonas triclosanedens TaxID=2961893 RepID=A0ABY7A3A7_9PSED|nr:type IV pilin protein [Pseudomonas triclosanedens]MCP8463876.1 type IV pilin protein [Pseudomonas triclosanedens]MCP8468960.1 type IV pilin protein [Pseudomonas triclosanedens]MCP8475682.1 type IV pilin protein [Pseudomonas triclosanedens]WAI50604.1 type IV pilin protein [Pseudomonas triclosanedens]
MNKSKGFTLVEMMIVVLILGILAAISYPSYQSYVMRSNRSEAMTMLNEAAARQERFFSQNNQYATTAAQLGLTTSNSPNNLYQLVINRPTTSQYTLTAQPIGIQARDTQCGSLTLDQAGTRGAAGGTVAATVMNCWK